LQKWPFLGQDTKQNRRRQRVG